MRQEDGTREGMKTSALKGGQDVHPRHKVSMNVELLQMIPVSISLLKIYQVPDSMLGHRDK